MSFEMINIELFYKILNNLPAHVFLKDAVDLKLVFVNTSFENLIMHNQTQYAVCLVLTFPQFLWITLLIHYVKTRKPRSFRSPQQTGYFLIRHIWAKIQQLTRRIAPTRNIALFIKPTALVSTNCVQKQCGWLWLNLNPLADKRR